MAHVSGSDEEMNVRIIALYPVRLCALIGLTGVRLRAHRKTPCTIVPCSTRLIDGRSVAQPDYAIPDGTPAPRFKVQLETCRETIEHRKRVVMVLSAEIPYSRSDPEQLILSPIYDDGHRMIYEFRRAYLLLTTSKGELETRFVAVDTFRGIVGTRTVHRFNTRLLPLASRCVEYLSGAVELFPAPEPRGPSARVPIPPGEADLSLDAIGRSRL